MNTKDKLKGLITDATEFGLPDTDVKNAAEFLEYNEWGLCFEIIVTQLYEFDIHIDESFYQKAVAIGESMKLPINKYDFIKRLIN